MHVLNIAPLDFRPLNIVSMAHLSTYAGRASSGRQKDKRICIQASRYCPSLHPASHPAQADGLLHDILIRSIQLEFPYLGKNRNRMGNGMWSYYMLKIHWYLPLQTISSCGPLQVNAYKKRERGLFGSGRRKPLEKQVTPAQYPKVSIADVHDLPDSPK